jgi:hypothetical protein
LFGSCGPAKGWLIRLPRAGLQQDVVRLHYPQRGVSGSGIHRRDRGSEASNFRPQNREVQPHGKVQALEIGLVLRFSRHYKALAFEKYLKSHSGRAFAKKRL